MQLALGLGRGHSGAAGLRGQAAFPLRIASQASQRSQSIMSHRHRDVRLPADTTALTVQETGAMLQACSLPAGAVYRWCVRASSRSRFARTGL